MVRRTISRQLAVIMFTDMVGFTALAQRSEPLALRLLREQRVLVRRLLPPFGGREVKTIGDGFLIRFESALRATECALAIQQRLHAHCQRVPEHERFCLRIGLHLGDIERPRRDVLGDCVNLAARIQSVAPAGGIAMSGIVFEHVRNQISAPFEFRGRVELKNVKRPVALFALEAGPLAALPAVVPPPRRIDWRHAATVLAAGAVVLGLAAARTPDRAPVGAGAARSSAVPSIAARPSPDAVASERYLRALALEREDRFSAISLARIQTLLEEAVRRDPGLALAHAALARNHVFHFDSGHDGSAARLEQARAAADRALRLQPELPEGHLALGLYHYYGFLDFRQALDQFERALARQPDSAEVLAYRGFAQRRLGRLPDAVNSLQRARQIEPRDPFLIYELAATHAFLRHDAEAERVCRGLSRVAPQAGDFRAQCLVYSLRRRGDLEPAHALERDLASVPNAGPDRHWVQYELALNEGRYADAQFQLQALSDDDLESWAGAPPREMLQGDLARWQGNRREAQRLYGLAEAQIRARLETYRDSGALVANRAFARALLGRLLARRGQREAALAEAERAADLLPGTFDRFYGASLAEEVAKIHLELGDRGRALDELEALLAAPSHTHIQDLRLQRQWADLWEHPRFLALVRRYSLTQS